MNRLNPAPESHPPWAADRTIQALMNLLYFIKIAPRESHEIDLYLELAQRELESPLSLQCKEKGRVLRIFGTAKNDRRGSRLSPRTE
jgi:hypothetical protein